MAAGLVGSTLLALVVGSAYGWTRDELDPRSPLTAVVEPGFGVECEDLVLPAPQPSMMPDRRGQFGAKWAYAHGGGTLALDAWSLTLQGRTDRAVVLQGVDVVDVERADLPTAPGVVSKCGGSGGNIDIRYFSLDFGEANVRAVARPGTTPEGEVTEPPVTFPYTVSKTDAEVFRFEVSGPDCLCSYRLSVRWSSGGKSGSLLVDRKFDKLRSAVLADPERKLPFNQWSADGTWGTY